MRAPGAPGEEREESGEAVTPTVGSRWRNRQTKRIAVVAFVGRVRIKASLAGSDGAITGSEHYEAVVFAGCRGWGGPSHGSPERWDWARVVSSLTEAQDYWRRREEVRAMVAVWTVDERAQLYADMSENAKRIRDMLR